MALSKEKKQLVVSEVSQLLEDSKLTVMARYSGTPVKKMQLLRADAKDGGTVLKIVKNRLVKKALADNQRFSSLDQSLLTGQLLYAFNNADEVAPARVLANFAKQNPQIEFVGAITAEGQMLSAEEVATLASLPTHQELRAQLVGTLSAPARSLAAVLNANLNGLLNALSSRAESMS